MLTYGYIREATMAHLDLDEEEAQAMNLQARFHIFANEAMQAICGSKPEYRYFEATIVKEYRKLVKEYYSDQKDDYKIREATLEELNWNEEIDGELSVVFLNDVQLRDYYTNKNIWLIGDEVKMKDDFIAFANKQAWKFVKKESDPFDESVKFKEVKVRTRSGEDFSYLGKSIKFYKAGRYLIPGKYIWFRFISGISDDVEIDMPNDILLTIPLYIASICLQIDSPQKANVKRTEFELALTRCTNTDFMEMNEIRASWD